VAHFSIAVMTLGAAALNTPPRVSTMLFGETKVPRSVAFSDADRCAQAIVDSVGYDLRLAVPVSIGKPILIVDALYRLAEADRRVQLTIFTA